jgi:RNA polymerase-binding transcription factor DksA
MEVTNCIKCGSTIPPKRLEIVPGTKTCVNCTTTSPKRGMTVMKGTGDHTWVELDIMSQEQFEQIEQLNKKSTKLDDLSD